MLLFCLPLGHMRPRNFAAAIGSVQSAVGVSSVGCFVQLKRCCVVCGCLLQWGHLFVFSGFRRCLYVLRKFEWPVRSCASVVRVGRERCSSSVCISGGLLFSTLLGPCVFLYCECV